MVVSGIGQEHPVGGSILVHAVISQEAPKTYHEHKGLNGSTLFQHRTLVEQDNAGKMVEEKIALNLIRFST